jgi:ketosteroid isomerase-like protein
VTTPEQSIQVILQVFRAVEQRDPQGALDLIVPDVEFHWPPPLPYGGVRRGFNPEGATWTKTWDPLQPAAAERSLSPRVIAASDTEVVVHWQQRGLSPAGDRIDTPVLGLYHLQDAKLTRAQMFYFDPVAVLNFLAKAANPGASSAAP